MSVHLSVAARTDVGSGRAHNEDAFVIADLCGGHLHHGCPAAQFDLREPGGALLAVSDGMGGHLAGEVASAIVVVSLARSLAATAHAPSEESLKAAVQQAHRAVQDAARHPGCEGMGATLTAMLVHGPSESATATIAEVGDSRAYLLRGGQLTRLTKDQNFEQLLVDLGAIDQSQAGQSPLQNLLLQAMGHEQPIKAELGKLALRSHDCVVLCSDGLTQQVHDEQIRSALIASPSPDVACERLIALSNELGGGDDVTVVVAEMTGDLRPCRPTEKLADTFEVVEPFERVNGDASPPPITSAVAPGAHDREQT
jgi:serine/threonine protein phosphatase PrpC